ncbi:MAG: PilW family protein [Myxococcales bacterium]|nr:prepilin-type N-terminal cleavage/methylation domain-containing protein [Myxococcales bacterium]
MKNRGFTLIEVMVGAAVAILVIGVVMATFLSQQRSMQTLDLSREASNAGRDALLSLQGTIGRAGYGIDPRYAFDLRSYNCSSYTGATTATNACRDKIDGPDQLVFVERDPNYYWSGTPTSTVQGCDDATAPCFGHAWQVLNTFTTTSPYQVQINARTNDKFPIGQVVQIVCAKGANPTMGTVSAVTGSPPGVVTLTLKDPIANNHYTDNIQGASGTALHDACFDQPGKTLFLVNRYRYFVMSLVPQQAAGTGTPAAEPWLMLDRGLDYNGNGTTPEGTTGDTADLIPIARGVEGFQVSYLLKPANTSPPNAPDSNGNWIIGDAPGVLEEPDPGATAPLQNTPDTDTSRFTMHPANIRGVRLRLTIRSVLKDLSAGTTFAGDPAVPAGLTAIENRNNFGGVTLGGYRRYFSSVAVATPNLNSKDPFIF